MSLISSLIITSHSLASREIKRVKQRVYQRVQKKKFTESIGQSQLITGHSSHVTHIMSLISCLIFTSLYSYHSSHVSISCHLSHFSISCHSSHVTHLMSHHYVSHCMSHHYVTHLMSHHYVTDTKLLPIYTPVARFNFCPWPLTTSHRIILPMTSANPLRSNLCQTCSVLLHRRKGIGFQGVSHSSQSRSHVTHLMSHHYVTQPGLKG